MAQWPRGRNFGFLTLRSGRRLIVHVDQITGHRRLTPGEWVRCREDHSTGQARAIDVVPIGGRP